MGNIIRRSRVLADLARVNTALLTTIDYCEEFKELGDKVQPDQAAAAIRAISAYLAKERSALQERLTYYADGYQED